MCQASAYMLEVQSQSSNIGGHKSNRNLHLPLLENVLEGHAFHNIQVGAVLKMCHVGLRNASNWKCNQNNKHISHRMRETGIFMYSI